MAQWIRHTHLFDPDGYECSDCGAVCDRPYPECPECGEPMGPGDEQQDWTDEAAEASFFIDGHF